MAQPAKKTPPGRQTAAQRKNQQMRSHTPTAQEIRRGMKTATLDWLGEQLGVSDEQLNTVLRISRSTRSRRQESGRLTHEESDRAANVMRAYAKAIDYFEDDEEAAQRWMKHPAPAFGGETPLQHCDTATGAQEVITLLSRLEYGIPA